ncbi:DUF3219 family protein [Planococcus halotolerans]|uniref:DUF3219 domain-containing protein n=1 Tax=Planococcus halotolerans TaxID=2233542 RepID=A0A365KQF8_9BACL|nr:DUF3219 family protein [Planococcus halotolerans]QHJ69454.1 DUF3219 family protein [Planococcus halotolerans]RAZ75406.1 DUF3219 domain-containing protein [Planococcus halotolerans]
METIVWIDDTQIKATDFKIDNVQISEAENNVKKISFSFKVSSEEYHDVAVLLYKNDFQVRVPDLDLEFPATIHNYATDRTDLYKEGQTADYYLELIEKRK